MKKILMLVLAFALAGCSGGGSGSVSSLNPFTWFKNAGNASQAATLAPPRGYPVVRETRPLIARVTSARLEHTPSGTILRATGLPPVLGYHHAGLTQLPSTRPGELVFAFRAMPPETAMPAGSVYAREITVAKMLHAADLAGVGRVRVVAAGNSLVASR